MKLRRFLASDSTKAMRKIKETLGNDAVILSTHSVDGGVEVVAAIDYDENVINSKIDNISSEPELVDNKITKPQVKTISELDDIKQEVQYLRDLLENQLSGFAWQNLNYNHPILLTLINKLTLLGFDVGVAEMLVSHIAENQTQQKAWLNLLKDIVDRIDCNNDLLNAGGYYAFVGPTGVGKTTTIAKLAARYCLQYGADNIGLVTMDSYRIAAVEQLVTYAKILGINVSVAQNKHTLQVALDKLKTKKLVLIDTAGMNPKDDRVKSQFEALQGTSVVVNPILVLSATSQFDVLESIYESYKSHDLESIILTKLDEAVKIGPSLSLLIKSKLALSYISTGQRVPEDLVIATKQTVLKELVNAQELNVNKVNSKKIIPGLSRSNAYV